MKLVSLLQILALGLSGMLLAFASRVLRAGPSCPSDEHNWALIAEQVAQGVDWPISGPLHFWLMQALVRYSGLGQAQALAFMGTWSVPLLVALMVFAYAGLGVKKPTNLLIVLACSTYFLAPLFESRPQQWGQVLVLLGVVFGWRAVNGLMAWWPYALVLTLTASVHILSFAILGAMSLLFWAILYALNQARLAALARLTLCVIPALMIISIPGGPYAAMIDDLAVNHLQISVGWGAVALALIVFAATLALALGLLRRFARHWLAVVFSALDRQPVLVCVGIEMLAVAALGLQALILPGEAWTPYRHSFLLFGLSQIGNLFFLGLSVGGLLAARQSYKQGQDQALIQAITVLLLSTGVIAFAALLASFWMLHTNWLLRTLNYVCLFMAPFAAMGFSKLTRVPGKWGVWLMMLGISFTAVVRPPGLFDC